MSFSTGASSDMVTHRMETHAASCASRFVAIVVVLGTALACGQRDQSPQESDLAPAEASPQAPALPAREEAAQSGVTQPEPSEAAPNEGKFDSCGASRPHASERRWKGGEESRLEKLLGETDVSWEVGKFHYETMTYIGRTRSGLQLAYLKTVWGLSCRATNRLLVFTSDDKYLGDYKIGPIEKMRIKGNSLHY